jgi:hypothetical protein
MLLGMTVFCHSEPKAKNLTFDMELKLELGFDELVNNGGVGQGRDISQV